MKTPQILGVRRAYMVPIWSLAFWSLCLCFFILLNNIRSQEWCFSPAKNRLKKKKKKIFAGKLYIPIDTITANKFVIYVGTRVPSWYYSCFGLFLVLFVCCCCFLCFFFLFFCFNVFFVVVVFVCLFVFFIVFSFFFFFVVFFFKCFRQGKA